MKNTYTIYYQDNFLWISPIIAKEFNLTNGQRVYSEELSAVSTFFTSFLSFRR